MAIRLGCCAGIKVTESDPAGTASILETIEAGYKYVELLVTALDGMEASAYDKLASTLKEKNIDCPAVNVFLPGSLKVTGPAVDKAALSAYVDRVLPRVAGVGTKIIVFGSGGARRVPEGFSKAEAMEQLADFLRMVSEKITPYGIRIAIEPLNKKECNIINTFADGVELSRMVNLPNICVLADYYHMDLDGDSVDTLADNDGKLIHTHIADAGTKRGFPLRREVYEGFLNALDKAGYDGGLSVEGNTADFMGDSHKTIEIFNELRAGKK